MKTVKKTRLFTIVMAIVFTVSTIFAVMMTAFAANQNKITAKDPVGNPTVKYCDIDFVSANANYIELKQLIWFELNNTVQWKDAEYELIFDKDIAPHIKSIKSKSSAEAYLDQHEFTKKDDRTWKVKVTPYATKEDKTKRGFFFTGLIGVKQNVDISVELDKPYAELAKKDLGVKAQVVNTKEKKVFNKYDYKEGAIFSETESATSIPLSDAMKTNPKYNTSNWLKASGMKVTYFPKGIDDEYIKALKKHTGNRILEADYKTTVPTLLMDGQFIPKVTYLTSIPNETKPLDMVITIPKDLAPHISKVTLFGDRGGLKDSKIDITSDIINNGKYVLKDAMKFYKNFEDNAGFPIEYRIQIELNKDISGLPIFNKNFLTTDVQMTSRCGQTVVPFGYQNAIIEFGYFDEDTNEVVPPETPDKPNENIPDDKTPQAPAPKEEIKDLGTPLGAAPKTSIVGTSIILSAIVSLTSGTAMVGSIRKKND